MSVRVGKLCFGQAATITGSGPIVGNDVIVGSEGCEVIAGNDGDDRLYGQADDARLSGGHGLDACDGGTGNDIAYSTCETVAAIT